MLALVDELDEGFVTPRFGDRAGWLVGGTLSAAQVRTFKSHPFAPDAVRLRRWADAVAAGATPTVDRPTLAGRLQAAWAG